MGHNKQITAGARGRQSGPKKLPKTIRVEFCECLQRHDLFVAM